MIISQEQLNFGFGDDSFEQWMMSIEPGAVLSAAQLLTALDNSSGDVVEDTFSLLEMKGVCLNIDDLPRYSPDGEAALRLRREEQLVKGGNLMESLAETDPLRMYLQELAAVPVCGDIQLLSQELIQVNHSGEEETDVHTAVMNLSLSRVVELACSYTGRGVLLTDLIQEGSIGLWQSLSDYVAGSFEAFRDEKIHWYLAKAVIMQAHSAGVGQKMRRMAEDYRAVDERLLAQLGRNPTAEEIAEGMHVSVREAEETAKMLENARILNRAKQPEQETLPQEEDQAVEDTAYFQMRQRIAELLSGLSEQDAKLLSLRYGLEGGLPLDVAQTGARLGLTNEEVMQKEAAALAKLRQQ